MPSLMTTRAGRDQASLLVGGRPSAVDTKDWDYPNSSFTIAAHQSHWPLAGRRRAERLAVGRIARAGGRERPAV
jgi:hypothetical protein